MKRGVVVSAILDMNDTPAKPSKIEGWDYIMFTNLPNLKAPGWEIKKLEVFDMKKGGLIRSKSIKWETHKYVDLDKYDRMIWVDGYCYPDPTKDWDSLIYKHGYICYKHHRRNCVYEELDAIIKYKKDFPEVINRVKEKYTELEYPKNNGLTENKCFGRLFSNKNNTFGDLIFELMKSFATLRDQAIFNLAIHISNFEIQKVTKRDWCITGGKEGNHNRNLQ